MKAQGSLPRSSSRGYTLVELMMALALLTVAVLGIISMQKVTVVSNAHAKNVSVAQRIAQSWASQLTLDATKWRNNLLGTDWLGAVGSGWRRPPYVAARNFGAAFDALGNPLTDAPPDQLRARYCANVRLTQLFDGNQTGLIGNGMMRAEVRVYWLRDGEADLAATAATGLCSQLNPDMNAISAAVDRYHFIYHATGVRQHLSI